MVANLQSEQITFDPRTGRYRSQFGGFLGQSDLNSIVRGEKARLQRKLERKARQMLRGQTTLANFERTLIEESKASILRMTMLAAGGQRQLTNSPNARSYLRQAQQLLGDRIDSIDSLTNKIYQGELTEKQILDRVRRQANAVFQAYNSADILQRITDRGHNEGRRTLDLAANHCPDCPAYQTDWTDITSIVPVGAACVCGGYCRCTVQTRFNPAKAISALQQGNLTDMVQGFNQNRDDARHQFARQYGYI